MRENQETLQQQIEQLNRRAQIFDDIARRYNSLLRQRSTNEEVVYEEVTETNTPLYNSNILFYDSDDNDIIQMSMQMSEKREYSKEERKANKRRLFKRVQKNKECPVCYVKKKKNYKPHCCGVIFCEDCVNEWMKFNNTCLICRK